MAVTYEIQDNEVLFNFGIKPEEVDFEKVKQTHESDQMAPYGDTFTEWAEGNFHTYINDELSEELKNEIEDSGGSCEDGEAVIFFLVFPWGTNGETIEQYIDEVVASCKKFVENYMPH